MAQTCPECGGKANATRDENGDRVLECLERECLHWEYIND